MIHWLVARATDHPLLAGGRAPEGLLNSAESARLAGLRNDKRRRDWLLGRWTAKHLLQTVVWQQWGVWLALDALSIETDPNGAPYAVLDAGSGPIDWPLSISHSRDMAFCALMSQPDDRVGDAGILPSSLDGLQGAGWISAAVGADIEYVEPRPWRFVEDYFTEEEIAQVRAAPASLQDTLVTAIWSGKESVLKALRVGLTVDTRDVSCFFGLQAGAARALTAGIVPTEGKGGWLPFEVRRAPQAENARPGDSQTAAWAGWWQAMEENILTLAVLTDEWFVKRLPTQQAR